MGIFDALDAIAHKKFDKADTNLSQLHPYVALQWMGFSGCDIFRLQAVNYNFFGHSRDVQLELLSTVEQKPTRRRWKWAKQPTQDNTPALAVQLMYDVDFSTAVSVLDILTPSELAEAIQYYDSYNSQGKKSSKKGK